MTYLQIIQGFVSGKYLKELTCTWCFWNIIFISNIYFCDMIKRKVPLKWFVFFVQMPISPNSRLQALHGFCFVPKLFLSLWAGDWRAGRFFDSRRIPKGPFTCLWLGFFHLHSFEEQSSTWRTSRTALLCEDHHEGWLFLGVCPCHEGCAMHAHVQKWGHLHVCLCLWCE